MLGVGKDNHVGDLIEGKEKDTKEEKAMEEDSGKSTWVIDQEGKPFLSSIDKEYVQALSKLNYKDEARKLVDDAYNEMKREPDSLMTESEADGFRKLADEGKKDEAVEMLDKAYSRAKRTMDSLLSSIDKEYIAILQELGDREDAKAILDKARKDYEERKRKRDMHLLAKPDHEYVDYLVELGMRDKARRTIHDIYMDRKTESEILADFMA